MRTPGLSAFGSPDVEINPALNVMIVYENLEAGKSAMNIYDYMVKHLVDQCLFANQMWKFDVLALPKLRDIAAKDAAAADIIIVSAHGENPLPSEVKAWIEQWLKYKTRASALVGLFGTESVENPVREYLAAVAKRAEIEFFCQPGLWPGMTDKHDRTTLAWEQNEKTFSLLSDAMQEELRISRWGINE
jgi:hypothetical protein